MRKCKWCGIPIPDVRTADYCHQCGPIGFDGEESHQAFFQKLEKVTLGDLLRCAIQYFDMKPRKKGE